jgi:hypothetical protein
VLLDAEIAEVSLKNFKMFLFPSNENPSTWVGPVDEATVGNYFLRGVVGRK